MDPGNPDGQLVDVHLVVVHVTAGGRRRVPLDSPSRALAAHSDRPPPPRAACTARIVGELGSPLMKPGRLHDQVLTVPNALSAARLLLLPLFVYLLLLQRADAWAVLVLMCTGASDWADGKLARVLNQTSKLGTLLDPAVDRLYMAVVPVAYGLRGFVPWWIVGVLLARDLLLAAMLPALRRRGLSALPVTYVGKAATFALMSAFPLILLGAWDASWSRAVLACGWGFLVWGLYLSWWAFVLYAVQVAMVVREMPKVRPPIKTGAL